ncbi:uncharacterized protein B0H64DRAFT_358893 [Chaetomium fimeti]|uniref:Myb-like domain-containing protein n=1 Tax=Chaetomium fimeti TaxID=1854472 RepID=A0AAE0HF13_9PEZI|nr:hypothetical protein B0H64DRAFT_358893 [Chaetomium fimeti]
MFISPDKPRLDVVSLRDNVFTFAAADFAPWLLQLNQINTALFLHQQRLHDMSLNQLSPKTGWAQTGPKPGVPQHDLPAYGSAYFAETLNTGESMSLTTGAGHSLTGNRTSRSTILSVSRYPTCTEPRNVSHLSHASVTSASELLDSSYWQMVPHGASTLPPFAHGGDPMWDHPHSCMNSSSFGYGHYNLDVASAFSQTAFRPAEALHTLSLPPMLDSLSSTNSKLYAPSGMLEAMMLDDDPDHSLWHGLPGPHYGYQSPQCTKTEPESINEKTVSPKLLKIRQTPTPASSCESLHTNFLSDAHLHEPPDVIDPMPSVEPPLPPITPKPRKQLPDGSQRRLRFADDVHRRHSPVHSDSASPVPQRVTRRLRPKTKQMGTEGFSPPPTLGELQLARFPDRTSQDDFLVKHKQRGLTYKEIRRLGGFVEAESTLRGRYRTLTKSREARVRKPEWSEKDLRLLEAAVRALSHTADPISAKVPWKKVADHILLHGGSYHFGNSTCRKRWDELVREQAMQGRGVRGPFFFGDEEGY